VHPDDRVRVDLAVQAAINLGSVYDVDHRVLWPDGTIRDVHEHGEIVRCDDGRACGMTGTVQDITARKQAEQTTARTLQRLMDAQRIGQIGDWEWDIATEAIAWSPQVFEITGRDPSFGPPRDYEENAASYDAASQALLKKRVTAAMESGEAQEYELRGRRPNGERIDVLGKAMPRRDESGRVVGLYGTIQDITARKQAEAAASRLLNVLEASLNEIYIFDTETLRFEYTNESALRNLGFSMEEMRAKTPLDLKTEFTAASFEKLVAPLRHREKPKVVFQTAHRRADESLYPVEVHLQLVQRDEREVFLAIAEDITSRKRSEAALRASEERFARAFEFAPMGMAIVATDGRWLKVNQAFCRLLGYSRAQLTGMKFSDVTHPDGRADDDEILRRLLARESRYFHTEKRYLHKDGRDIWVWLGISMVSDPEGRPLHFISQIQDITARKEAEALAETSQREQRVLAAELQAEKDRLVAAQAVAKIGSWETDFATQTVIWSDETYRIFEIAPEDFDHTLEQITGFVHPDDRRAVEQALADATQGQTPSTIEHRIVLRDGRIKFVEEHWQIEFAEDGTPLRAIGTCQDITDRRNSDEALRVAEEKYRSIFDNSSEGIFQTTLGGAFVSANPALARMTRFDSPEELIRERNDVERQGYLNPTKRREFQRLISQTGFISDFEYDLKCKDGSVISVSENTRIVRDDAGNPLYYEGSIRDVTEHKRAELELEELNKQLLQTSRHAGMAEVATSVLHNVGNVLNSVNVSCSVISDKVRKSRVGTVAKVADLLRTNAADLSTFFTSDPAGQKLPDFIDKLSERLADEQVAILTEVQSLSQNIAHIKEIVAVQQSYANVRGLRETLPITGLVEDALRINAEALNRHHIEVIEKFTELPPISVDKHKVLQILVNLVRNAKHALVDCNRTDKRLTVCVGRSNETRFRVSVADNGIGIDPQNITRVFAHGFTTKKNGHGYGLHSGVLAAHEMGGSLTVESAGIGRGATFTLELPLNGSGPAS
jgi:PAS domain S-box-containing protein